MYGRIDHEKYMLGLKTCSNFIVRTHGGISNRAGIEHLGICYWDRASRFIPFQFNTEQAYLLEIAAISLDTTTTIMRVWKDGGLVIDTVSGTYSGYTLTVVDESTISIVFDDAPAEDAPPYLEYGDEIVITDEVTDAGMDVSGLVFVVNSQEEDGVTFTLVSPYNYATELRDPIMRESTTSTFQKVYHLKGLPYNDPDDLPLVKFTQSADTLTLTHPSYPVTRITRTDHDAWTLESVTFAPVVQPPSDLTGECYSKDGLNTLARYRVTSVDDTTFEESTPVEVSFRSNKSLGLPSLNVYTELDAQPHPIIENRLRWTRNTSTASNVLRYNVYRSMAHGAFTFVGSAAGDEDPSIDSEDTLAIDKIEKTTHTVKRIKVTTVEAHRLRTGDVVFIDGILSEDTSVDTLADTLNGNRYKIKKVSNTAFTLRVLDNNDYIEYPASAVEYARINVTAWSTATPTVVTFPVGDNTYGMDVGTYLYVDGTTGADSAEVNGEMLVVDSYTATTSTVSVTLRTLAGLTLGALASKTIAGGKLSSAYCNDLEAATNFVDRIPMTNTAMGVQDPPTPMTPLNPFDSTRNYPECSTYHEQRQWYGNTDNAPNTLWATQIALYKNMNRKAPVSATDAVIVTLPSTKVNPIYHMVSLRDLIIFTGDGDWRVDSTDGAINAASARAQQQSYIPCSRRVPPVPVSHRILYAEDRGKGVRDLSYGEASRGGLQSVDRTVYARHLFDNKSITSMAFQSLPFSVLWVTNSEGDLLAMSYEADQDVYAWSTHRRDGVEFVQAVTLSEGDDDNLYVVQKIPSGEGYTHVLGKMHNRQFDNVHGARFLDEYVVTEITMNPEEEV